MTSTATAALSAASDQLPLTISAAAVKLRDGSLTSVDLTRAAIARADKLDDKLGTYISRTDEAALAAAAQADEELAKGVDKGLLHGIPLGIKDIITVDGVTTTAQSLIMRKQFSDQGDAVVVRRLKDAGAVITGTVTTMEYAVGLPDPSKGFPTPRNPFDPTRWTGGSSSGTGNGVASGLFLGGLGTDTGGSIRLPASWCGISGMKQTFGRVPKSGCAPLGLSFDHIGPMTRSARDAAAMLAVLAGHDESDACCVDRPVDDYVGALTGSLEGLKVGVDLRFLEWPACDPDVVVLTRAAIEELTAAGADVVDVTLPLWDEMITAGLAAIMSEAFTYHRPDMQTRWTDYGRPTRAIVSTGALVTAADYVQAQRVRRFVLRQVEELFADVDLIVTPTTLTAAPALEGLTWEQMIGSVLTQYWNGSGCPAMSVPMGLTSGGLPAGLQLAGRPFEEGTVFRAADAFQQRTDHHLVESPYVLGVLA